MSRRIKICPRCEAALTVKGEPYCRECRRLYNRNRERRYRAEAKPEFLALRRIIRKTHDAKPESRIKRIARTKVQNALKTGRLIRQPCEACGSGLTHAHHPDYTRPLDVRWLCPLCHATAHRLQREASPNR